jgi:hypothetical protein
MKSLILSEKTTLFLKAVSALVLLLFCNRKISSHLESQMDLRFYDESYYLTQGFFHSPETWIADFSPLYSLWYRSASIFFRDPVALYYTSYRFWAFLFGLMVFGILWFSRRAGTRNGWFPFLPAQLWAMAATASELSLPLWPKAGHLAMLGSTIGMAGLLYWKNQRISQLCWVAGIGLLFSWCRPEFLAATAASVCLMPMAFFFGERKVSLHSLLPLVPVLVFFFLWGFPLGQSGRGFVAFGQHFVHNWRNINGNNQTDFLQDWVNWRPIFQQHFGSASNPLEALINNPVDMLHHLWFNFRYLVYNGLVCFSETIFPKRIFVVSPLYGFVLLLLLAEWKGNFRTAEILITRVKRKGVSFFLPWISLALPPLLAGFLFQPRLHYILPLFPFFVLLMAEYFRPVKFHLPGRWQAAYTLILPLVFFFFLPDSTAFFRIKSGAEWNQVKNLPDYKGHFQAITTSSLRNRALIEHLRHYPFPAGFRIFDASTGATEYLGDKLIQCGKTGFEMNYETIRNFPVFLDSARVDGIFLNETMYHDNAIMQNSYWQELRKTPDLLGWNKLAIGEAGDSLLIRNKR